jgi:hypothetical protein
MRLYIDARKDTKTFSDWSVGKASMENSREQTVRTRYRVGWEILKIAQCSYLNTWRFPLPEFLPRILGGNSGRIPGGSAESLLASVLTYRGGGKGRLIASAVKEILDTFQDR